MPRKKLKPEQERFWNRLTGQHNHRIRAQLDYMLKNRTITAEEHRYLVDRSYGSSEAEIWRLIIDHIRISTMQDFHAMHHKRRKKQPRKQHKKPRK